MNKMTTYSKPNCEALGNVSERICATHIKGPPVVIETVHWHIQPAYDLDE